MAFMIVILLTACQGGMYQKPKEKSDLLASNHQAGKYLLNIASKELDERLILVASFVSVNNLDMSSSFGRITSQQVATQFSNSGFKIEEMLLRKNVRIEQKSGEFLLSRDLKKIDSVHNAQAVIVGTYAVAIDYAYITAKVINTVDSKVIASYDYKIPLDKDIKYLLRTN